MTEKEFEQIKSKYLAAIEAFGYKAAEAMIAQGLPTQINPTPTYGCPALSPVIDKLRQMYGPLNETRTEIGDIGSKCAARLLLSDRLSGIVVPTKEEWIGVNLLSRDDEMPNRRK